MTKIQNKKRTKLNPLLLADFYKQSHADLYDDGTEIIYATWTPRRSLIRNVEHSVVFGFQMFILKYLVDYFNENFFERDQDEVIAEYLRLMKHTIGNCGLGEARIRELHNLGYLPVRIDALEEGSICPIRVPCMTIQNTKPEFFWVTNFLETLLSMEIWMPMTSATLALEYKKIMNRWADKTCDNRDHVAFQCHDFSMRGMAGLEACELSGLGHLTSFKGTDTIPAIVSAENYYDSDVEKEVVAKSIGATEHSIMENNSAGKPDGDKLKELEAYRRIISEVYPEGMVSVVSDTWNLWEILISVLPELKTEIMSRDGKIVVRPDSGNPVDIICGTTLYTESCVLRNVSAEKGEYAEQIGKGVIELLWDEFGGSYNSKGYKVLDSHVGCVYGDAITIERAEEICKRLESKGFASSNIVFGVGSFTYQYNTRDTLGFALKTTYAIKDGQELFLFKDPITDDGTKKSQKGMVFVRKKDNGQLCFEDGYCVADKQLYAKNDLLKPLFEDGQLLREVTLEEVRDNIERNTYVTITN